MAQTIDTQLEMRKAKLTQVVLLAALPERAKARLLRMISAAQTPADYAAAQRSALAAVAYALGVLDGAEAR